MKPILSLGATAFFLAACQGVGGTQPEPPPEEQLPFDPPPPEEAFAEMFVANLSGENIVPEAVDTTATASATAFLVDDMLIVGGAFAGLSSDLRDLEDDPLDPSVHIHPGAADETNSYIYGLVAQLVETEQPSGTVSGTFFLSDEEIAMLRAETLYMDIHTEDFEDGELRDQLRPAEVEGTFYSTAMTNENVLPDEDDPELPNTGATGSVTAFLTGNLLIVGGTFEGLSSDLRDLDEDVLDPGIHIHPGDVDDSNPYIFALVADLNEDETSGSFSGAFVLNDEQLELLESGLLYADIHTTEFEDGEVRGQLLPMGMDEAPEASSSTHRH